MNPLKSCSAGERLAGRAALSLVGLLLAAGCGTSERDEAVLSAPPAEAAAGLALGHERYAALHHLALQPTAPGWADALDELATRGDGFTLVHLGGIEPASLTPDQRERLARTVAGLERRRNTATQAEFVRELPLLLERAAWVDLMCDPLESALPAWTRATAAARIGEPGVRDALERLRDGFQPTGEDHVGFGSLRERVRSYVSEILSG